MYTFFFLGGGGGGGGGLLNSATEDRREDGSTQSAPSLHPELRAWARKFMRGLPKLGIPYWALVIREYDYLGPILGVPYFLNPHESEKMEPQMGGLRNSYTPNSRIPLQQGPQVGNPYFRILLGSRPLSLTQESVWASKASTVSALGHLQPSLSLGV